MTRMSSAIGSVIFFIAAPCIIAGLLPWMISGWVMPAPFPGPSVAAAAGTLLIVVGLVPLIDAFRRFAMEGRGTPAPIAPTEYLVGGGPYRHVRNPMYVGVVTTIAGQALLFASWPVALYGAVIWLFMHLFVVFYEEPTLADTFGESYRAYRAAVPRWLPRLTPATGFARPQAGPAKKRSGAD